jgi:hypothetical protein
MAVLSALRRTPGALQRNPILFVPVLVITLFQVPQLVLQSINPLLASVVSLEFSLIFILVKPFFQAGIIGMADEALDGRTSLESFLREGKVNYVSVLVACLVWWPSTSPSDSRRSSRRSRSASPSSVIYVVASAAPPSRLPG